MQAQVLHPAVPPREYCPAPQMAHDACPSIEEYFPAGQEVHPVDPASAEYFPAGQTLHVPADDPLHGLAQ